MKKCIVNFAEGAWYPKGQARLKTSLEQVGFDGDFIGYKSHVQLECPPHSEVPYGFKPHALYKAMKMGYDLAIYADASIFARKDPAEIFNVVNSEGYFFEAAGHWTGTWCKDEALESLKVTRDEAMKIPMLTAGFVGLNFHSMKALTFLDCWLYYARDGISFPGPWWNKNQEASADPRVQGHRHDMTAASVLADRLAMKLHECGTYLAYVGKQYAKPKDSVIFLLQPC